MSDKGVKSTGYVKPVGYEFGVAGTIIKSKVVERDGRRVREIQKVRWDEVSLVPGRIMYPEAP